jgi:Tetracyclin repressor-like, C-terminal domain
VWRAIDTDYGLGMLETAVQNAMDAGRLAPGSASAVAHVLAGALDEAAMVVARADDPQAARAEMGVTVRRLLEGLRGPRP